MFCCSFQIQSKSATQAALACVCALSQSEKPTLRILGLDSLQGPPAAQVGRFVPQVRRRDRSSGVQLSPQAPEDPRPGSRAWAPDGLTCGGPAEPTPRLQPSAARPGLAPLRLGAGPRSLGSARQNLRAPCRLSPLPFTVLRGSDFHKHDLIQPWLTQGFSHSFNLRFPHRTIPEN